MGQNFIGMLAQWILVLAFNLTCLQATVLASSSSSDRCTSSEISTNDASSSSYSGSSDRSQSSVDPASFKMPMRFTSETTVPFHLPGGLESHAISYANSYVYTVISNSVKKEEALVRFARIAASKFLAYTFPEAEAEMIAELVERLFGAVEDEEVFSMHLTNFVHEAMSSA